MVRKLALTLCLTVAILTNVKKIMYFKRTRVTTMFFCHLFPLLWLQLMATGRKLFVAEWNWGDCWVVKFSSALSSWDDLKIERFLCEGWVGYFLRCDVSFENKLWIFICMRLIWRHDQARSFCEAKWKYFNWPYVRDLLKNVLAYAFPIYFATKSDPITFCWQYKVALLCSFVEIKNINSNFNLVLGSSNL